MFKIKISQTFYDATTITKMYSKLIVGFQVDTLKLSFNSWSSSSLFILLTRRATTDALYLATKKSVSPHLHVESYLLLNPTTDKTFMSHSTTLPTDRFARSISRQRGRVVQSAVFMATRDRGHGFNSQLGHVVASLGKAICDNFLCLVDSYKQQILESQYYLIHRK